MRLRRGVSALSIVRQGDTWIESPEPSLSGFLHLFENWYLVEIVTNAGLPTRSIDFENVVRVLLFEPSVDVLEVHLVRRGLFQQIIDEVLIALLWLLQLLCCVVGLFAIFWRG